MIEQEIYKFLHSSLFWLYKYYKSILPEAYPDIIIVLNQDISMLFH
jgi:hypothetical protein